MTGRHAKRLEALEARRPAKGCRVIWRIITREGDPEPEVPEGVDYVINRIITGVPRHPDFGKAA